MKSRSTLRRTPAACLVLLAVTFSGCLGAQESQPSGPETEDEKLLYALGLALAQNVGQLDLSPEELVFVQSGFADAMLGRDTSVELAEYGPKLQAFAQQRMAQQAEREQAAAAGFLEAEAAKPGAARSDSGVIITEISPGSGDSPTAEDTVTVHYTGTLRDGSVFDSSVERGQPATFPLSGVISCWTEGLQTMKVGGKSRLVCPADTAYGDQGRPGIPGGAALVFEVELIGIEEAADAPEGEEEPTEE